MRSKWMNGWMSVMVVFGLLLPAVPSAAADAGTPALQYGFEDGTTQGWAPMGSAALSAAGDQHHSGNYSLAVTGRNATYSGPSINLTADLKPGATYEISGYVKMASGEPAGTLKFTMKRDGSNYDQVAASATAAVTDADWVKLDGRYAVPANASNLLLYVESPDNAASGFYLDDVAVTMVAPPPGGDSGTLVADDFENGSLDGWAPRGGVQLTSVTDATYAYTGSSSLLTTNRTANWNGPSRDVTGLLKKRAVYEISVFVKLAAVPETPSTVQMTVENKPTGGSTAWTAVANQQVADTVYTELKGSFSYSQDMDQMTLYVESNKPTESYYIDHFTVKELTPPPVDNSGIRTDFEDGTAQSWRARIGEEQLTVTTADRHGGQYSLLTSGRAHAFSGPTLDVTNKMATGSKYAIAVWAKLAPGEAPSRLRVSIQRDYQGTTNYDTVVGNTAVGADGWVKLEGTYQLNSVADKLSLYVETDAGTASYYIDDFSLTYLPVRPIQTDIPSVYQTYADYFQVGAEVQPADLLGQSGELLKKHFNSIVAGNQMKPSSIQPTEGTFNWGPADQIANFARENHLHMRGHTLVWHQQVPDWFFQDANGNWLTPSPESKQLVLSRLETHIRAVMNRYKDVVDTWDVVNEVIDPSTSDGMRHSRWYELTGTDYIDTAFRVAHEVDPNATLFINDYSIVADPAKRQILHDFVQKEIAKGVPISGVGFQMHINIYAPSDQAVKDTVNLFAGLGVKQEITELDMSVYTNDSQSYTVIPDELLVQQGYRYRDLFNTLKGLSDKIDRVTFWGMSDDTTWLRNRSNPRLDDPLLFDDNLQAKYAYWGIVDPSKLPVLIRHANSGKGTPRIDGAADTLWDGAAPMTVASDGSPLSAQVKTLWDEGRLYVLADVTEPNPTFGSVVKSLMDALEPGLPLGDRLDLLKDALHPGKYLNDRIDVFVDENNGKTTSYQSDDAHYSFKIIGKNPQSPDYKVRKTKTGYRFEAAVPLQSAPAVGGQLGFDIRITDTDGSHVLSWNDTTDSQDSDTSKFGTLDLLPDNKLALVREGTPVVDGAEDPIWSNAAEISTGVWVQGSSGATGKAKLLWDSGHLYVYATVSDGLLSKASANAYEQDSIELFVDPNNAKTPYYEPGDGQYRVNFDNEQSYGGSASASSFRTATRKVDGGYIVEAAISLDPSVTQANGLFGFDFQVNNDEDGDGTRDSVAIWSDPTGQSYQNTSRLGTVKLIEDAGRGRGDRRK